MRFTAGIFVAAAALAQPAPDFARDVHPLLVQRCGGCHGSTAQGGLSLTTRAGILAGGANGPAVAPGRASESLLMHRITGERGPRMPLGSPPLSAPEMNLIRRWIDAGAHGAETAVERRAAPMAPRKPAVPPHASNPIDAFLSTSGNPPVTDALFARRVYLDLHGLLPPPDELSRFEHDTRPGKRARLIDALLGNNERYAAHWISFWNDLLRNDEGVIYHGERKPITRWLKQALETNLRYDTFVSALLNPAPGDGSDGFLTGVNWRGDVSASELPPMQAAQNSAQVFLGVNLKCNSCHDSFISRWKLKDAYGLASFFSEMPLEMVRCDVPTGEIVPARFLFPELGGAAANMTPAERRAAAASLFTSRENGRFARTFVNRIWKRLFGRGIVEPVDDMDAPPFNQDLLDWLAWTFAEDRYDIKVLLRRILTSRAYQMPAVASGSEFRGPLLRRLTAEQFVDAVSSITGEWRSRYTAQPDSARFGREWEHKSTPLSRALGRPVRDYVTTERDVQPATLQMLEMVNGETLAGMLRRGALRIAGKIKDSPPAAFDSGTLRNRSVQAEIDITGASKIWLILKDIDSYDPSRVIAGWAKAEFAGPAGTVSLASLLKVQTQCLETSDRDPAEAVMTKVSSEIVVDIAGRGFTRFRGFAGADKSSLASDIKPEVRFFVFTREPDRAQLIRAGAGRPVAPAHYSPVNAPTLVYRHALGRIPTAAEAALTRRWLGARPSVDKLEDFLWAIVMSPEFQYIR